MKPIEAPKKPSAVRHTIHHDRRERVRGLQRNIGPLSHRDIYVEALRFQSLHKAFAV